MKFNILALQFNAQGAFEKVEKMYKEIIAANGERSCDILFLPEVWAAGWDCKNFKEDNDTLPFLIEFARKNNVNIIGGSYIRKTPEGLKNSCPVISRTGEVLAHYDKNHLFIPDGEDCLVAGEKLLAVELEGLKMGLSICYDIRFPELFRAYIQNAAARDRSAPGAQPSAPHLFVNLSAWPKTRTRHYTTLCGARAIENQVYFLGLSQTGEIKEGCGVYNSGNSLLVDPFGDIIEQLGEEECYIFKTIDTQKVAQIREKFPNLAAMRDGEYEVDYV